MAITVNKTRVPVTFEKTFSNDSRFMKVKIWIAHTGENLNNSIFSKETFENMLPTLAGVPIVGYVHKNDDNEDDFKGHEQELVIEEGGIKLRYKGHAYGFIPENPNAQFEIRDGKQWITAEGIVWTKFDRAIEIFEEAQGVKSQSMEISNVEGSVDDAGRLVITDATFSGLCILGEDSPPAMTGSTVEVFTVNDDLKAQFANEVTEMMTEFYQKGDDDVSEKTDYEEAQANEVQEEVVVTVESAEETELQDEQTAEDQIESESTDEAELEADLEIDPDQESGGDESFGIMEFKLSLQEVNSKVYRALDGALHDDIYILDTYADEVVIEYYDYNDGDPKRGYEKLPYTVDNDEVVFGTPTELVLEFLTVQEKQALEITRSMFEKVEAENEELKAFKFEIEKEEKESILEKFSARVNKETLNNVRERLSELSLEDIQKELAYEVFKAEEVVEKATTSVTNFSSKTEKNSDLGTLSIYAR